MEPGECPGLSKVAVQGTDLYGTLSTDYLNVKQILARSKREAVDRNAALTAAGETAAAVPEIVKHADANNEADQRRTAG